MAPISHFYLSFFVLIHLVQSQNITILKDGETWFDDYNVNDNAIGGWKYPPSMYITTTTGSDRTYHGWFYKIYTEDSLGYFSRQFQCEYDSFINISFIAFFGCSYDSKGSWVDGVILYINQYQFEYKIEHQTLYNYTDPVAINQTMKCKERYDPGTFVGFNVQSNSIEVDAYTTFDIGFRMINLNQVLEQEFGAISDITVMCNKVNESQTSPKPRPPILTVLTITDPSDSVACSNNYKESCAESFCSWNKWDQSKCSCSGGDAVDIMVGIGISSVFQNDATDQSNMEQWLLDDVIHNMDIERSRFGLILFDETVSVPIDIDYYSNTELNTAINSISWVDGFLNYAEFFVEAIAQFNNIQTPNTQQILIIVTDNNPETPQTNGRESTVCQYRTLLASAGIRVIMVVIDYTSNLVNIDNYECITQNSFDLLLVTDDDPISAIRYDDLNTVTNILSAALCPHDDITIEPSISPTTKPTVKGQGKVDFIVETAANTTETTKIFIVAIIANITGLDSTQITIISSSNGFIVSIVGTNGEIDLAERKVDEIEEGIEDITGKDAKVTDIHKTYSDEGDEELKHLLLYLIIGVSVLVGICIVIGVICCYCLCIKKRTTKAVLRMNGNYHKHVTPIVDDERGTPIRPINVCESYPDTDVTHRLTIDSVSGDSPQVNRYRQRSEGDYAITATVPIVNVANDIIDEEEEEDEEVNKLYFKDSDDLSLERQQTMTRDGGEGDDYDDDNNNNMHIRNITPQFNLQQSLHSPHQLVMLHSISATPFNLTPVHSANNTMNLSLHNIDLQGLQNDIEELSQNLPLPIENIDDDEDNEVVNDMTHECKDGEIDHEDIDEDDDVYGKGDNETMNDTIQLTTETPDDDDDDDDNDLYGKGDNETMNDTLKSPNTIKIPQNVLQNDDSSSDDNHEAMYDKNNKTNTDDHHFEHQIINIPDNNNNNKSKENE